MTVNSVQAPIVMFAWFTDNMNLHVTTRETVASVTWQTARLKRLANLRLQALAAIAILSRRG